MPEKWPTASIFCRMKLRLDSLKRAYNRQRFYVLLKLTVRSGKLTSFHIIRTKFGIKLMARKCQSFIFSKKKKNRLNASLGIKNEGIC